MNSLDILSLVSSDDVLQMLRGWLRTERQRLRWTQAELARRSGVPAATISRLELTGLGSTDAVLKILFALNRLDAVAAGVTMMPSRLIETKAGTFFATKRFDRTNTGGRLHFTSAAGLLHADYRTPGDEYLLLFKLTDALLHDHSAKEELFRRVTLNVLKHNRDDHLKNFGFLMDAEGHWSLAPFYDFTYSDGPNGWQTLSVAGVGENPTQADLDRLAKEVWL